MRMTWSRLIVKQIDGRKLLEQMIIDDETQTPPPDAVMHPMEALHENAFALPPRSSVADEWNLPFSETMCNAGARCVKNQKAPNRC